MHRLASGNVTGQHCTALAHALLDCVHPLAQHDSAESPGVQVLAAGLLLQLLKPMHARLAAKAAEARSMPDASFGSLGQPSHVRFAASTRQSPVQGFNLSTDGLWSAQQAADVAAEPQHAGESQCRAAFEQGLAARIRELLGVIKTQSPAVALLLQLRDLAARHFDREAISRQLLSAGQLGLAIRWASELGPSFQVGALLCCCS